MLQWAGYVVTGKYLPNILLVLSCHPSFARLFVLPFIFFHPIRQVMKKCILMYFSSLPSFFHSLVCFNLQCSFSLRQVFLDTLAASFDRSYHQLSITLIFDPIMGIFIFFGGVGGVQKASFGIGNPSQKVSLKFNLIS